MATTCGRAGQCTGFLAGVFAVLAVLATPADLWADATSDCQNDCFAIFNADGGFGGGAANYTAYMNCYNNCQASGGKNGTCDFDTCDQTCDFTTTYFINGDGSMTTTYAPFGFCNAYANACNQCACAVNVVKDMQTATATCKK